MKITGSEYNKNCLNSVAIYNLINSSNLAFLGKSVT